METNKRYLVVACVCIGVICFSTGSGILESNSQTSPRRGIFQHILPTVLVEVADGGGLEVEERDLGWGSSQTSQPQQQMQQVVPLQSEEGESMDTSTDTARRVYTSVKRGLARGMTALSVNNGLAQAYQNVAGLGVDVAPDVMAALSAYVPLAIGAQKQLTKALEGQDVENMGREGRKHTTFQYGLQLNDEYDTLPQARIRRFREADVPKLKCSGDGDTKLDRLDDCELSDGKEYNRMFYLDRRRSNVKASAALVHRQMQSVKRLAKQWKHLLVEGGGGPGTGAFDDPYYFCYDQYQEDPELSTCLRELAQKGDGEHEVWARGAVEPDGDLRVGFPKLRKEWEKELAKGAEEGAGEDDQDKETDD